MFSSVLAIFFFAICCFPLLGSSQECTSPSYQLDQPPRFICSVEVLVQRNDDCSASITEKISLPHTTGADILRSAKLIREFQSLSKQNLTRDGKKVQLKEDNIGEEDVRFLLPSENVTRRVDFELSYHVSNSVMIFSKECEGSGTKNDKDNVIRWSFGFWEQEVSSVSVRFLTTNKDAKLSLTGDRDGFQTATKSDQDVTASTQRIRKGNTFDLYIRESNVDNCPQKLRCFNEEEQEPEQKQEEDEGGWSTAGTIGGAVIGSIVLITVCLCVYSKINGRRRRGKQRYQSTQVVPIHPTVVERTQTVTETQRVQLS